nr:MAG TPA: hypothetical protein [Caudoviricetes sp.]
MNTCNSFILAPPQPLVSVLIHQLLRIVDSFFYLLSVIITSKWRY